MNNKVTKIVVTGGPCAGKTSAMAVLHRRLSEMGLLVVVVPEAARDFRKSGLMPELLGSTAFQSELLSYILEREDRFESAARLTGAERIVLLCDRGTMDGAAYIGRDQYRQVIESKGLSIPQIRDPRYDAVIHLRTAALGAPEFYATDDERLETIEEAIALDELTCNSWVGHPHVIVIDNSTGFERKKQRVLQAICRVLGIPVPLEIERKFLVARSDPALLPKSAQVISIMQWYLESADPAVERRIRKRTQHAYSACYYTNKRLTDAPDTRIEQERLISEEALSLLLDQADPKRRPILKNRTCFVYRDNYYELDDFSPMGLDLWLLEVELTEAGQHFELPDFLTILEDVTGNPAYSNAGIALAL